ncbi:MAG TPA: hypothetical protein VJZ27_06870 [Aggregatilineales bacterium]|nr:hypothetical protein [Aggregatilineales bacterium]
MTDNPNLEKRLQIGITAARGGNREAAQMVFQEVLKEDRKNERAWLWLAFVTEDVQKRQQYLETVLKINPNNSAAQKALNKYSRKRALSEQRTLVIGVVVLLLVLTVSACLCLVVLMTQ